jgi:hypothetical protein
VSRRDGLLTAGQRESLERDGYLLVPSLLDEIGTWTGWNCAHHCLAAATRDCTRLLPGPSDARAVAEPVGHVVHQRIHPG